MDDISRQPQSESFFEMNARLVAGSDVVDEADRDLVSAFMTIGDLTELLHDANMNAINDMDEDFIVDVLIVDTKEVINCLRKYLGNTRTGILEAKKNMDEASLHLYAAQMAAHEKKNIEQAAAFIACGVQLDLAYGQLKHLDNLAQTIRKQEADRQKGSLPPAAEPPMPSPGSEEETPPIS